MICCFWFGFQYKIEIKISRAKILNFLEFPEKELEKN